MGARGEQTAYLARGEMPRKPACDRIFVKVEVESRRVASSRDCRETGLYWTPLEQGSQSDFEQISSSKTPREEKLMKSNLILGMRIVSKS